MNSNYKFEVRKLEDGTYELATVADFEYKGQTLQVVLSYPNFDNTKKIDKKMQEEIVFNLNRAINEHKLTN